ncbi:ribonuclease H-like domain-containing protein [Tanacetum coccineum]
MTGEYNALVKNKTWTIVHRPTDAYIVRCMWSFRHKYLANDTLSCYKARLVANDSSRSMLDVKNAFLHRDLFETVYMHQPLEYRDSIHPDYVCLLQRSLYGIKQGPRTWFRRFAAYTTHVGFSHSCCDSSLFIYRKGTHTTYLLLYVDDIVSTALSEILLQRIIASLHKEFSMMDLVSLSYFLVIFVTCDSSGMFLSLRKYDIEILEWPHMVSCNPSRTLVDTESKLGRKKLRIKGGKEKAIEKSLKGRNSCSLCGGTDHNKRTCPRRFEGQDEVVFQKEVGQEEVLVQKEVCQEGQLFRSVDLAKGEEELSKEDEDLIHE